MDKVPIGLIPEIISSGGEIIIVIIMLVKSRLLLDIGLPQVSPQRPDPFFSDQMGVIGDGNL